MGDDVDPLDARVAQGGEGLLEHRARRSGGLVVWVLEACDGAAVVVDGGGELVPDGAGFVEAVDEEGEVRGRVVVERGPGGFPFGREEGHGRVAVGVGAGVRGEEEEDGAGDDADGAHEGEAGELSSSGHA